MGELKKVTELITKTICDLYLFCNGASPSRNDQESVKTSVRNEVQANMRKDAQKTIREFVDCITADINNSELELDEPYAKEAKENLIIIKNMYFNMFGKAVA